MRDLILKMSMSLDGFVSDMDGRNGWMFGGDPAAKRWSVDAIERAGLHVMGRRTFLDMAAHWPDATDAFAAPMNRVPKAVFARGGVALPANAGNWSDAYVARGDLAEEIDTLKAQPGAAMMAHGGVRFARSLIAAGLVDRYMLLVHPVALGVGQALFSDLTAPLSLTLVESIGFPGGAVAKVYATT